MSLWKTTLPVAVYRLTRGRVFGRIGGQTVLLLETTGRRTGRSWTTPVEYIRDVEHLVVVASNGGAAGTPAWLLNLRADPHARVQLRAERRDVTAREATGDEHRVLWTRLTSGNRRLETIAQRTGRRPPILVLSSSPARED